MLFRIDYQIFSDNSLTFLDEMAEGLNLTQSQVVIQTVINQASAVEVILWFVPDIAPPKQLSNKAVNYIKTRLGKHQVKLNSTLFGNYTLLYAYGPGEKASPPPPQTASLLGTNGTGNGTKSMGVSNTDGGGMTGVIVAVVVIVPTVGIALCGLGCWVFCGFWRGRRRENQQGVGEDLLVGAYIPPSERNISDEVSVEHSVIARQGPIIVRQSSSVSEENSHMSLSAIALHSTPTQTYSLSQLKRATKNFSSANLLGEGGFSKVYKGELEDTSMVAVKLLKQGHRDGEKAFLAEARIVSCLHHKNLVKLLGICPETKGRCLVYELVPYGSLHWHLHGTVSGELPLPGVVRRELNWEMRMKIALGVARGLSYLHEDAHPHVIHRDINTSNILLEEDFTPKISDFGSAQEDGVTATVSTQVVGTFGYLAPECSLTQQVLRKSDVYSFGVVLLELLSGRPPVQESLSLAQWAAPRLQSREGLMALLDPQLKGKGDDSPPFLERVAALASMCLQINPEHRPFMGEVVQALRPVYSEPDTSESEKSFGPRSEGPWPFNQEVGVEAVGGVSFTSCELAEMPDLLRRGIQNLDSSGEGSTSSGWRWQSSSTSSTSKPSPNAWTPPLGIQNDPRQREEKISSAYDPLSRSPTPPHLFGLPSYPETRKEADLIDFRSDLMPGCR